jgi:hypothetical protein
MNFLEIVQKLHQKCGGAGTAPSTVVAQTGESKDFVDWASEAIGLIETLEANWMWMRKAFSFQTTAGKAFYLPNATAGETGLTDLAKYHDMDSWRIYLTATGRSDEGWLVSWDYQSWRDHYDFGIQATQQERPQVYAIRDNDRAVMLGGLPNDIYTVTGEYQRVPQTFTLDADTPGMPTRFHMMAVYRGMMLYGKYENAPEVYADGEEEFNKLLAALKIDQLQPAALGEPLA